MKHGNKLKKRIKLNIEEYITECIICNEIKELRFCAECLNQLCWLCYSHIVIRNNGTPVCPFCRDGEEFININHPYNNALKIHRYEYALRIISESK